MVIPRRLGDRAISLLRMREFISKYDDYKKKMHEGSALSKEVLVSSKRIFWSSSVTKTCRKCL